MFTLICNLLSPNATTKKNGRWIRLIVSLPCLLLIIGSAGCNSDCAQWKVAEAINTAKNANPEEAIELLQTALRMHPECRTIKIRLANLLAANDQGDLGLTLCDEVLENDPSDKHAWEARANCLKSLGRFEEALADCQECLADQIDKNCWQLNALAYDRGLAGVELDKALRQINLAVRKFEKQQSWGDSLFTKPLGISCIVSASLISRYTDDGHLFVRDLLNDTIFQEKMIWQEMNERLKLLKTLHKRQNQLIQNSETNELLAQKQQNDEKQVLNRRELTIKNLTTLLAARSLIFEDQGRTELADLDRLWLKRIGVEPELAYSSLPNDAQCFDALKAGEYILDTRGFLLTQMPWQTTWTDPTGKVMRTKSDWPRISYGRYDTALRDLDIAVAASEVHLLALNTDIVNRVDFPIKLPNGRSAIRDLTEIPTLKSGEKRMVAVLRNHRRQAHLKANQIKAAEQDLVRIKELGFEAGPSLF